jgi:cell division protein ZipA
MPELRWILIVAGAALLLGIYLWGRRSSRQAAASDEALRSQEPLPEPHSAYVFRDEPAADVIEPTLDAASAESDEPLEPIVAERRHRQAEVAEETDEDAEPPLADTSPSMKDKDGRRARIEPKFGDGEIETASASQPTEAARGQATPSTAAAPTLSMSNTPQPRRSERRKIIALRIAAGAQRFPGEQLLAAMEGEGLQHGKYDVFHRIDDTGATLFSVASMVEPGTFDPLRMAGETFPGITLFTQFPGAVESMLAFNEMVQISRRLQERLGGTLQDERGVPLTIHRLERLRQDIRDFDQGHAREAGPRAETAPPVTP